MFCRYGGSSLYRDSMEWTGVVGTISGDDTIFVLCKTEDFAKIFTMNMEKILNAKNS